VGTGQNFSDSSPDKNVITALGGVTHSAAQSKFSGGSIYFDGTTDALRMPPSESWAFGTADWTVDFWHYRLAMVSWSTFLDTYSDGSGTNDGFLIGYYSNTNKLGFYSENAGNWHHAGGSTLAADTWYHVAYVRSGNNLKIYLNGVVDQSFTLSASDTYSSQYLYVGSRAASEYINGYMDEVRITKGTALWTSAFTPPTRRNRSAPVVDLSGHDNGGNFATKDMTDVVTYRDGQVIEPVASAVWDFDGTDDRITGNNKPLTPGTTWTISVWFKPDTTSYYKYLYSQFFDPETVGDMMVRIKDDASIQVLEFTSTGGAVYNWYTAASTLTAFVWKNVTVCRTGAGSTDLNIYINGELMSKTSTTGSWGTSVGGFRYGIGFTDSGYYDGKIAAVQVYDTPLTPQQVKQNFNSQRSRFKV
jgi:hypothetical protein